MQQYDTPLALFGYPPEVAAAFRASGLLTNALASDELERAFEACQELRYLGALLHPSLEARALPYVSVEEDAAKFRGVNAVAFSRQPGIMGRHGIYAQATALSDAVSASGFQTAGANLLLIGNGSDLVHGLPLVRLGFKSVGLVTEHLGDAERYQRELPRQGQTFALSRLDSSLPTLAQRADLIVLTGGTLPPDLVQPYHTFLDLSGQSGARREASRVAATVLELPDLASLKLARQLWHATGQRYHPGDLSELAQMLESATPATTLTLQ